jgi:glycosyltransferase involved in cell wall biosynthesis
MARMEGGLRTAGRFDGSPEEGRPLVSVVTVCLNSERHIAECMESVLAQTYDNIEYIIVDGGSTDRTLEIMRGYDERIAYWISEPDEGIYDAMNKGVGLARGDLVGILNSDDAYFPYTVEEVVRASLEHPEADVFHGDMLVIGKKGETRDIWRGSTEDMARKFQVMHPTCFVRRSIYDRYHYRLEFSLGADCDLMFRLDSAGHVFYKIERPLALFRTGGASSDYYRSRREIYLLRKEHGLIGPWEYRYKRAELVAKAALVAFKAALEKVMFKEHAVARRERDYLYTDNIAMKDEIARASAHIEKLEREIEIRNAELDGLREAARQRDRNG